MMSTFVPGLQASKEASSPFEQDAEAAIRNYIELKSCMSIQVTPIENGYVIRVSTERGLIPRLIYAADLTAVGQQITAFAVAQAIRATTPATNS